MMADRADDLKRIVGIGRIVEERLNDVGVFTFEQLVAADFAVLRSVNSNSGIVTYWRKEAAKLVPSTGSGEGA